MPDEQVETKQYVVQKTFNKYAPGETVELPNELVGQAEIEKLLKDGNITFAPGSEPQPEAPASEPEVKEPDAAENLMTESFGEESGVMSKKKKKD